MIRLLGAAAKNAKADKRKVIEIVLSWVLTLPIAFILAFSFAKIMTMYPQNPGSL